MEIKMLKVGMSQTNCYIVYDRHGKEATVIDPGAEANKIIDFLKSKSLSVKNIILTHGHFDHILAVQQVKESLGGRVIIHEADARSLGNAHDALYMSIMREPFRVSKPDILLKGGEKTRVGLVDAEFLHTPGHTPGSMCIIMDNVIFTGDTLFCGDVGRSDLKGGDEEALRNSLKRLYMLPYDYIIYPGHGEPTSLGIERDTNEFLQSAAGVKI